MGKLSFITQRRKNIDLDNLLVYEPGAAAPIHFNHAVKGVLLYFIKNSFYLNEQIKIYISNFSANTKKLRIALNQIFLGTNLEENTLIKEIELRTGLEEVTGYDSDHFNEELSWEAIIYEDDYQAYLEAFAKLSESSYMDQKYRIFHKNGEVIWVQDKIIPVYDSETDCILLERTVTNFTIQKAFQESMKQNY